MGVLRAFLPYGRAGCACVCVREMFWQTWLLLWVCSVILGNYLGFIFCYSSPSVAQGCRGSMEPGMLWMWYRGKRSGGWISVWWLPWEGIRI